MQSNCLNTVFRFCCNFLRIEKAIIFLLNKKFVIDVTDSMIHTCQQLSIPTTLLLLTEFNLKRTGKTDLSQKIILHFMVHIRRFFTTFEKSHVSNKKLFVQNVYMEAVRNLFLLFFLLQIN